MRKSGFYNSLARESEGIYKEKGSKFISYAYPVTTEQEIKELLYEVKKKYHDARHHCFAYRLGEEEPFVYRINDDGEPSGTAGKPIYGKILSYKLTNILIVVVRYFGGTLLGTGGLVKAYKGAAEACLKDANITQMVIYKMVKIRFPYDKMSFVMRVIREEQIQIEKQLSDYDCEMKLNIPKLNYNRSLDRFSSLENVQIKGG